MELRNGDERSSGLTESSNTASDDMAYRFTEINRRLQEQIQETEDARSAIEDLKIDNKRLQEMIYQLQETKESTLEDDPEDSHAADALAQSQVIAVLKTELTTAVTESDQYKYEARMASKELEELKKRQSFLLAAHERLHTQCEDLRKAHEEMSVRLDEKDALLANAREKLRESSAALVKTQGEQRESRRRSHVPSNFTLMNPPLLEDGSTSGLKALRLGAATSLNDEVEPTSLHKPSRKGGLAGSIREETDLSSLPSLRPASPTLSSTSAQSGSYGMMRSRSQDITNGTADTSLFRESLDSFPMSRKNSELSEISILKKQLAESEEDRKAGEVCMKALREHISLLNQKVSTGDSTLEDIKLPPLPSESDEVEDGNGLDDSSGKLMGIRNWKLPTFSGGGAAKSSRASVSSVDAPSMPMSPKRENSYTASSMHSNDSTEPSNHQANPSTHSSPFSTVSQFFGRANTATSPLPASRSFSTLSGTTDDADSSSLSPSQKTPVNAGSRGVKSKADEETSDGVASPNPSLGNGGKSPSGRASGQRPLTMGRMGSWFSSRSPTELNEGGEKGVSGHASVMSAPGMNDTGEFDEIGL